MTTEKFSMLLKEFGKTIGIPDLAPDESDYCCLEFDDHVINIEYDDTEGDLYLYAHITDLPLNGREALYQVLLEGDYFFRYTNGGVLGIDTETERVILAFKISIANVDPAKLEVILENFLNTVVAWKQKTNDIILGNPTTPEETVPLENGFLSKRA